MTSIDTPVGTEHLNAALERTFSGDGPRAFTRRDGDVGLRLTPLQATWLAGIVSGRELRARQELVTLCAETDRLTQAIVDDDLSFVPAGDVVALAASIFALGARIVGYDIHDAEEAERATP